MSVEYSQAKKLQDYSATENVVKPQYSTTKLF